MSGSNGGGAAHYQAPCILFVGDFNVGKSSLINALLRRDALFTSREESRALPTFIARGERTEACFAALTNDHERVDEKGHDEFWDIRQDRNNEASYIALAAQFPSIPFSQLVLMDTAGASSDSCTTVDVTELACPERAMLLLVTDIEYWASRHTMEFIASHLPIFGDSLIVVANKADHLNGNDIRRICEKAPDRMKSFGIHRPPRFLAVSARLELARYAAQSEYRHRTRREVRELCDAGMDALRVALYEFEASHIPVNGAATLRRLLESPIVESFLKSQGSAVS